MIEEQIHPNSNKRFHPKIAFSRETHHMLNASQWQQCDQIWPNFAILPNFLIVFGQICEGLFSILQNTKSTLTNDIWIWPIFHCCTWPKFEKYSSHLVTLVSSRIRKYLLHEEFTRICWTSLLFMVR